MARNLWSSTLETAIRKAAITLAKELGIDGLTENSPVEQGWDMCAYSLVRFEHGALTCIIQESRTMMNEPGEVFVTYL